MSAQRVNQVTEGDPIIYSEKAKSILMFATRMRLAVRETPEDARAKLKDAAGQVA